MTENALMDYSFTSDLLKDAEAIIESARDTACRSVNLVLVQRNWLLGKRIALEVLQGEERADYGMEVIKKLSRCLTDVFGKGFTKTNIYDYYAFYKNFPDILHSVSGKSSGLLSWTHYRVLLQEKNKEARDWYADEAYSQTWSVRTLQRNIYSQYYFWLLSSQNKKPVEDEMKSLTAELQNDKLEFVIIHLLQNFLALRQTLGSLKPRLNVPFSIIFKNS